MFMSVDSRNWEDVKKHCFVANSHFILSIKHSGVVELRTMFNHTEPWLKNPRP